MRGYYVGQEIESCEFTTADFMAFKSQLSQETALLREWLESGRTDSHTGTSGLELEACLIDKHLRPASQNELLIKSLNDPMVVPELAKFNIEVNTPPFAADTNMLSAIASALTERWNHCLQVAAQHNLDLCLAGVLPSLRDDDLHMGNVSPLRRYQALNQQILKGRRFRPLDIHIESDYDSLTVQHNDVMTEASTTSLQIHLQLAPDDFAAYYNASLLASAPLVAACANSPLVFGKLLWDESRIPLFEQSVAVPCFLGEHGEVVQRVNFGSSYLKHSVIEIFEENMVAYPVLLPFLFNQNQNAPFAHLQLHNGTIWRWNRALLKVNDQSQLQFRLEHRTLPAGPTITDCVANIAFFYGLVGWLAHRRPAISFAAARQNFYRAARYGLRAKLSWDGREQVPLDKLLLDELIPAARKHMETVGFDRADANYYVNEVVGERVRRQQTGAIWQRNFYLSHNRNLQHLMAAYLENGKRGAVYTW